MKKMLSFALALMLMLSITSTAFAAGEEGSDNAPQLDPIFELTDNIAEAPQNDTSSAAPNRTVITGTITDVSTIQSLVNDGTVECDQNGNIPTKIVVTQIIDNTSFDPPSVDTRSTQPKSPISISKTDYYDGRYLEEYDRYEIDGPSEFTKTYSRTSTASWNSDMSASVEVIWAYQKVQHKILWDDVLFPRLESLQNPCADPPHDCRGREACNLLNIFYGKQVWVGR